MSEAAQAKTVTLTVMCDDGSRITWTATQPRRWEATFGLPWKDHGDLNIGPFPIEMIPAAADGMDLQNVRVEFRASDGHPDHMTRETGPVETLPVSIADLRAVLAGYVTDPAYIPAVTRLAAAAGIPAAR